MDQGEPFKFIWLKTVLSGMSGLPPTTRLVLCTLNRYMDASGKCFPSISTIMEGSGLSNPAVIKHLKIAVESGWIRRGIKGMKGQKWKRHQYNAILPEKVANEVNHLYVEGGKPQLVKVANEVNSNNNRITKQTNQEIHEAYLMAINPLRKSKQRSLKNILEQKRHLKKHSVYELLECIKNYSSILNNTAPKYRKDPANFFGITEPYFIDYLPGNFEGETQPEPPKEFEPPC